MVPKMGFIVQKEHVFLKNYKKLFAAHLKNLGVLLLKKKKTLKKSKQLLQCIETELNQVQFDFFMADFKQAL